MKTSGDIYEKAVVSKMERIPGPVILISRECGCSAKRIAGKLARILTGYSYLSETKTDVEWKWVGKEILEEAARQYHTDPGRIKDLLLSDEKYETQQAYPAYPSENFNKLMDEDLTESIRKIILRLAEEGNCIIVGKAACIVAQEIPRKLSIKLQAPPDWRINRIMQINNLTHSEAEEYVMNVDRQRDLFVEHLAGREMNNYDFDLIFNYSTIPDDQIVDAIITVIRSKHFVKGEDDE